MALVSKLALVGLIALSAVVCGGCGSSGDRESEPLATRASGPIGFLRGNQIVVVDPEGSNERALVRMPRGHEITGFSWSPDGERIVFSAHTPVASGRSYQDIYFVNADGSDRRKAKRTPEYAPTPVWSPRGNAIGFEDIDDGYHTIWVVNADGSDARKVPPGNDFAYPAWSPDGAKIAYLDGDWIKVMNADGSAPTPVIRAFLEGPARPFQEGTVLQWAPAKQIVFDSGDIWVVNPDGSGRRMAAQAEGRGSFRVSPDGRTIAFSYLAGVRNYELSLAQISGREVRRLTNNDVHDLQPSWAPDGKSLAFARFVGSEGDLGPGDIYLLNADGSGERNLTNSAANESSPAWSPKR
jgi:Tol biopolymer transport system component